MTAHTPEELRNALDLCEGLRRFMRVDEAPRYKDLMQNLTTNGQRRRVLDEEFQKLYKSATPHGGVYLIKNPALIEAQIMGGLKVAYRVRPLLVGEVSGSNIRLNNYFMSHENSFTSSQDAEQAASQSQGWQREVF